MKKNQFILAIFIVFILIFSGCTKTKIGDLPVPNNNQNFEILPQESGNREQVKDNDPSESENDIQVVEEVETDKPKDYFVISVDFASQAPYGVWDELHDDACEEASMVMAANYFNNEPITPHTMEQGLISVIKWEEQNGYRKDLVASEVADILQTYFRVDATVNKASIEAIKTELLGGNLVIIPAAGRKLGNPNFTGAGPIYHMLLITGFDDRTEEFITNDPGTRKGQDYRYSYSVIMNAIHDWNHDFNKKSMDPESIMQTQQVMIVVSEKSS